MSWWVTFLNFKFIDTYRVDTLDNPVSSSWILNLSGDDASSTSSLKHKNVSQDLPI